jgi:hypothetical protein
MGLDSAITARLFEPQDEPAVLEVLQAAFGQWPRDIQGVEPSEFFHWKHVDGPHGPSILVVAEADGAVIGFAAYMPWQFRARGQMLKAVRGVDFAIDVLYRRRGASMALRAAAKFSSEVSFIWSNPNDQSHPGGRKFGRRDVGRLPRFVQPRGQLRETIRRARARGSRTPEHLCIEAGTAAEVLGDDTGASLFEPKKGVDRLATDKNLDYLRWRYGRYDEYRAIRAEIGGDAHGVVIFRCRRHGSLWVTHICELFVEHDDRRAVRRLLERVRDAAPADIINCSFASRRQAASCGLLQYGRGSVLTTHPLQQNLVPDPTRLASWALSLGDLELL